MSHCPDVSLSSCHVTTPTHPKTHRHEGLQHLCGQLALRAPHDSVGVATDRWRRLPAAPRDGRESDWWRDAGDVSALSRRPVSAGFASDSQTTKTWWRKIAARLLSSATPAARRGPGLHTNNNYLFCLLILLFVCFLWGVRREGIGLVVCMPAIYDRG